MGTRAKAYIHQTDLESEKIACIYTQFDGYPDGFLTDITKHLNKGKSRIINGINNQTTPEYFNGMGCMAAYLVGKLKGKEIGGISLYPINDEYVASYTYHLFIKEWPKASFETDGPIGEEIHVKVISGYNDKVWEGKLSEFPDGWDNDEEDED